MYDSIKSLISDFDEVAVDKAVTILNESTGQPKEHIIKLCYLSIKFEGLRPFNVGDFPDGIKTNEDLLNFLRALYRVRNIQKID